jgi:predicted transcriptional regulator
MAWEIVANNEATPRLSKEEVLAEIKKVYIALSAIEKGEEPAMETSAAEETAPAISLKKAFGKKLITCMICHKQMKTLARHLKTAHDLKPGEYRKQFAIPRTQPLAARDYSETRKQMAIERGLGENLAKARAAKGKAKAAPAAKPAAKKPAAKKAAKTAAEPAAE